METTATTSEDPATVEYSFEFRGNTGEFFKIWTVNMLLTIVTLGVFSAWAKVRTKRYFNGNTFLAAVILIITPALGRYCSPVFWCWALSVRWLTGRGKMF